MNRPEEREPSPGSAWPWIIFSGEGAHIVDPELGDFEELSGRDKEAAERLKATLEAPCDYARWLRLDAWTLQQAACIIGGIDPDRALGTMNCFLSKHARVDTPGRFEVARACAMFAESLRPMLQEMRGSHFAGKLKILGPWLDDLTMVDPSEAIRWAASKGYDIPVELEHQAGGADVETPSGILPGSSFSSPAEFLQYLQGQELDEDEIKFRMYHDGQPAWDLTQWKVDCLVVGKDFPPNGAHGEVGRNNHKAAYLRSEKRHRERTKNTK